MPAARGWCPDVAKGLDLDWFELFVALLVILASAELFTNALEWIGDSFGLTEGAVGSVLAAVGTALPETLLPLVAIALGHKGGQDIGLGAILGAPLMLTTLAMFVLAVATLIFARGGARPTDIRGDRRVLLQDLGYFLVMYSLAVVAGVYHHTWFKWGLAATLMLGYAFYVYRHFKGTGGETEEAEAHGEIRPLYVRRWMRRTTEDGAGGPPVWASLTQCVGALAGIVLGARIFVVGVDHLAATFKLPGLVLALLIAPIATELPEKFNSVLWVRRRKDTLALGNLTGAMVFQSSFPVTIGLLLTPWRLTGDALVAAVVALCAGSILWLTIRIRGALAAKLLLVQGLIYAVYVTYVLSRL
jgi:cation:H+ antiporter